jgi:cytochrome b subunit of formate dehydrogenase
MSKPIRMSRPTRLNWLIDAVVVVGGILAGLSGIYFLYLPSGGYQGGRNPMYGVTIFFDRHTWSDVHVWGGVLMMVAIAVHFAIHWQWIKRTSRRSVSAMLAKGGSLSKGAKINIAINLVVAVSFLLCAVSGIYFLFGPSGGYQGGRNSGWDPGFLFSRVTWDLIHTWSGVVLSVAAVVHFAIHWRWVKNVTLRFFLSLWPQPRAGLAAPAGKTTLASSNQG